MLLLHSFKNCAHPSAQALTKTIHMQTKIILFDTTENHENLLPLSFTRPISDFRIGILTIREKWEKMLPGIYRYLPVEYLREKFGNEPASEENALFISGSLLPDPEIIDEIISLPAGEAITDGDETIAFKGRYSDFTCKNFLKKQSSAEIRRIRYTFDAFLLNPEEIRNDFFLLTKGRKSAPLSDSNKVIGDFTDQDGRQMLFIEKGAYVEGATINLSAGPVYIGKNSEIMEGSSVRGPLALCDNAKIRMNSKIYGGCTFGPYCKVGGEIDNSILFGFSNKAHDGYLGNAVIGEWCNIGAGVNASNLKNDYSKIRIWNYHSHTFMRTDLQFCGPIIGDHTKIGVNCMLNTATVLGVCVNLYGAGFPRAFVPSFSEGSPSGGFSSVPIKKFLQIAERVLSRREVFLNDSDRRIYEKIYEVASSFKG